MIGTMVLLRRSQLIMSCIALSVAQDIREVDAEGNARMSRYFNPVGGSRHKGRIPALPLGLSNVRVYALGEVPEQQRRAASWSNPRAHIGKKPLHGRHVHWRRLLGPADKAYVVVRRSTGANPLLARPGAGRWPARVAARRGFRLPRCAARALAEPEAVA